MDLETFKRFAAEYDVVPVVQELSADTLTPVSAFAALSTSSGEAFLLESVEKGENLGRYSFIGHSPRKTITFDRGDGEAVSVLRQELQPLRVAPIPGMPRFAGGAIGYFGYGVAGWSEKLPDRHTDVGIPEAKLLFFDNVIVFDHVRQRLLVIANLFTSDTRPREELFEDARSRNEGTISILRRATADLFELVAKPEQLDFQPSCSRDEFVAGIIQAKEEIVAGEIFQIVLSQRWSREFPTASALTLYRCLRTINPSPYMFLLRTEECTLVGSSPEMLVRVADGLAETRPIAGTRPRGATIESDLALEEELRADPKENAEHLMLVDLGRNDLGRVSERGTVRVTESANVERYSHVMHIVSHVTGRLREDLLPLDCFLAAFPAGTVTGAPKIRAMELIDEIENIRRGPYAGAIAYAGFSGNLDSCIAIRTIVLENDKVHIQAGAGIVFDSDPETEYEETMNKAAALKRAVEMAVAVEKRQKDENEV